MQIIPHSINPQSRILIVGDFPSADDWSQGLFWGPNTLAGRELSTMLRECGIELGQCSVTAVTREKSPQWSTDSYFTDKSCKKFGPEILRGIEMLELTVDVLRPTIILCLGDVALQTLTSKVSVSKWRGSVLPALPKFHGIKVVCTYAPTTILKMWEWRTIALRDIGRFALESQTPEVPQPDWRFHIRPSYETVLNIFNAIMHRLEAGPILLSVDIETRGGMIACIGIAWSKRDALCIPLMAVGHRDGYWTQTEEELIYWHLRQILQHPNVRNVGQNFAYDVQYFAIQTGIFPKVTYDTMLMQHVFLLGMKKSLDFIASLYCEQYKYWKDDGKEWDAKIPEEQYWTYNCEDCVRTYECAIVLEANLAKAGLTEQYEFLRDMWPHVVRTMLRGVRVHEPFKAQIGLELWQFTEEINKEITEILGHPINIASPKQMMTLFYDDLQMKPVKNKKTGQPTSDDDALVLFKKREPLLKPLVERIQRVRSANVLRSTFAEMPLDSDKRMRCFYNLAGTETLRLSSRENAFGSGGNLQNIPKGDSEKERAEKIAKGGKQLLIPEMRKMFIPDPGMTFFDVDLDRADLMIVIWEADDDGLRTAVAEGVDLHTYNASALFGIPESRIVYRQRQAAKMFAHGTNYGGSARTMAINCGFTTHESEIMQRRWFSEHPGIKDWHRRTESQLQATREVRNVFGFRRRYFGRIEAVLPEALAWQPQSCVALVINKGWKNLAEQVPEVQVLLQVHDSLAGQFPTIQANPIMRRMRKALEIPVPYPKPLTIGVGIATSESSWGDCKNRDWPAELQVGNIANTI